MVLRQLGQWLMMAFHFAQHQSTTVGCSGPFHAVWERQISQRTLGLEMKRARLAAFDSISADLFFAASQRFARMRGFRTILVGPSSRMWTGWFGGKTCSKNERARTD